MASTTRSSGTSTPGGGGDAGAPPAPSPAARRRILVVGGVAAAVVVALVWATAGRVYGLAALVLAALWVVLWASSARPARWRVVDIVVAGVLGVACGLLFWAWGVAWTPLSAGFAFFPPLTALLDGVWLLGGVLGGLVVRRPGAALFTELVAALVEALIGNQWGFSDVWYGLLQGLGAEVVLAALLYRRWGLPTALAAGAGAGVVAGALGLVLSYPEFSATYKVVYVLAEVVSGAVLAGLVGWVLTRALAASGALAPLASGRTATRV